MLEAITTLAYYGYGNIGNLLNQWQQMGFFTYLIPFLLIFALVFGILDKMKLFKENKAITGIIAFVVGIMAIQSTAVSDFFSEIMPRAGIGIAILLVAIIFLGMFLPKKNWANYVMLGFGAIVLALILINSTESVGWISSYSLGDYMNWIVPLIILIIVVVLVVKPRSEGAGSDDDSLGVLIKGIHE